MTTAAAQPFLRVRASQGREHQGRTLEKGGAVARGERAPPHSVRRSPRRQSRPVDDGRKSRVADEHERTTRGRQSKRTKTNGRRVGRRARRRRRGKSAGSEKPFVSVARCFRGIGRTRKPRRYLDENQSERARAEPHALFRAQYARRARPVRCRACVRYFFPRQCYTLPTRRKIRRILEELSNEIDRVRVSCKNVKKKKDHFRDMCEVKFLLTNLRWEKKHVRATFSLNFLQSQLFSLFHAIFECQKYQP